jgi:hypothetical protein
MLLNLHSSAPLNPSEGDGSCKIDKKYTPANPTKSTRGPYVSKMPKCAVSKSKCLQKKYAYVANVETKSTRFKVCCTNFKIVII